MKPEPQLSAQYWDERYKTDDFGWDLGSISTPLKHYFDQLTNKEISILIPGAGNAYEAEYLIQSGFGNVHVCDFALSPLENLKKRCPEFPADQFLHSDFFLLQDSQFDIIIEQTFFCALDPTLRKKYFEKMHSLLKPSGKIVGLLFDDVLNADKPPFGGNAKEYSSYFIDLFKVHTYEKAYNSIPPREGRELFINLRRK